MAHQPPSLDKVRAAYMKRKNEKATTPGQDVGVDKEGNIVLVDVTSSGEVAGSREVSRVPKDTFVRFFGRRSEQKRVSREQSLVNSKLPTNTYRVDENGVEG